MMMANDDTRVVMLVERLRSRNGSPTGFGLGPVCDEAAAEIERLTAELAAAQANDRRYRWLRDNAHKSTALDLYGDGALWRMGIFSRDSSEPLDAAIDSAMEGQSK